MPVSHSRQIHRTAPGGRIMPTSILPASAVQLGAFRLREHGRGTVQYARTGAADLLRR